MNRTGKWAKRAVWATLAAVLTIGCNPLTMIGFIFHRDDKVPAEVPLRPKEGEKAAKDKEVSVLVLVSQGPVTMLDFAQADRELARELGKKLTEMAQANKEKLKVVPETAVDKFKMASRDWKAMSSRDIGKKLGADYVLEVHLAGVNVYQPDSGNLIYEGRAEVTVEVYDVAAPAGTAPVSYPYPFVYPKTGIQVADSKPLSKFKAEFLEQLALEIALKHIEHKPGDYIANQR